MTTVLTGTPPDLESTAFAVEGMNCASCVSHVEKAVKSVAGVSAAEVNLARGRAVVRFDSMQTGPAQIADAITSSGYKAHEESTGDPDAEQARHHHQTLEARSWLFRAVAGLVLWLPLELAHWVMRWAGHAHHLPAQATGVGWAAFGLSTAAMIYLGSKFFSSAAAALRHGTSNMDTLISMGAGVAYGYSLIYFIGGLAGTWAPPMIDKLYFMEASGLLALISLGHGLEARARDSAGSAIRELLQLVPPVALRFGTDGTPTEVSVSDIQLGDRLLVRPGDRIPIDGAVVEGRSSVDESMISGEPVPVLRQAGDNLIGGTVNLDGRLIVRATKVGQQTMLAQIVALVESAQSDKPPVQRLADRVSAVFVPSVLLVAAITAIGWYTWGSIHGWERATVWSELARAVCSVLIIACPCALGLAVPTAVMVGTGRGARRGILFRDIDALERSEHIDTVVLDKTGTLTIGRPRVDSVQSLNGMTPDEIVRFAAAAEQYSEHPLGKAVMAEARKRGIIPPDVDRFVNEPGLGVVADVEGRTLLVGSAGLLRAHGAGVAPNHGDRLLPPSPGVPGEGIRIADDEGAHSFVYVASKSDGAIEPIGLIRLSDSLKEDSVAAVASLKKMGLRTILLSGDRLEAAQEIGRQAGIDDIRANVLPAQKAEVIRELQRTGAKVAMVGDGINDAPALAAADLGIAIGSGSDIAKEAGGVILVSGSLSGVAVAIRLSRATMSRIRQNLFLAFIYNVLAIPLAAFGLLNPLVAATAMALSDVTVIGNALLLRRRRID